jgi:flagellar basal-body rod protein FlgC
VFDPTHPYASDEGVVTRPVVDLATQMADMIGAQRTYQANLSVIKSSRDAYASAMQIGR